MSTHRNIDRICIVVLVLTLLLTVAFMNGEKLGIQAVVDEDAENYTGTAYFTANDQDGTWSDNAYTTYISLSGDTAKVKGNGAYAYDGGVVITNGGWYVLSGTLTDGSITVDAYDSSKIWLRLEGVDVACSDDACLIVDQADKVFLTLADGSENSFTSGASYSAAALKDNTGGAIFTHDDLTINGSGSLTITANYKHGIDANDSLVITGGTISITAPQDGIHVNDSFRFMAADLTISAGDDAVHSDVELYVESGTILITECYEGLEAVTIDIAGGDITVYSSDDGLNANGSSTGTTGGMGGAGGMNETGGMQGGGPGGTSHSAESGSGTPPDMSGEIPGTTGEAQTTEASETEETYIRISGGTITIINENGNDADGLDSNGNIYLDGGMVYISLKGDGSNCAIDYNSESGGECIVTGGTIVACAGSSMAEGFSSGSTQCAVLYNLDSTVSAGTEFRVLDVSGNEVLSYTPQCSYSSVSFSSPDLAVGETYTVVCGEQSSNLTLDTTAMSVGSSGGMGAAQPNGMDNTQPGGMGSMQPEGIVENQGEDSDDEERGAFPDRDGESDSDRPSPPDGEMGAPPGQNADSNMEPPDFSNAEEGAPVDGAGTDGYGTDQEWPTQPDGGGKGMNGFGQEEASDTGETESESTGFVSLKELDQNVWILLGVSLLILAGAILFAAKYRK